MIAKQDHERSLLYNIEAWRKMYIDGQLTVEQYEQYVENAMRNVADGRPPSAIRQGPERT